MGHFLADPFTALRRPIYAWSRPLRVKPCGRIVGRPKSGNFCPLLVPSNRPAPENSRRLQNFALPPSLWLIELRRRAQFEGGNGTRSRSFRFSRPIAWGGCTI